MKMYCVYSMEAVKAMGGNRGKLASMAGHAFLHSFVNAVEHNEVQAKNYFNGKAKKVTLVVETTEELLAIYNEYKDHCGSTLVVDAGLTVFDGPTTVCAGFGPVEDNDDFLKTLKVFM